VRLQSIVTPLTEFDHPEKGDALYGELPCLLFLTSGLGWDLNIKCLRGVCMKVTKAHCCQKVEFILQLSLASCMSCGFQYMDG
jgi:hypothetical protein